MQLRVHELMALLKDMHPHQLVFVADPDNEDFVYPVSGIEMIETPEQNHPSCLIQIESAEDVYIGDHSADLDDEEDDEDDEEDEASTGFSPDLS